VETTAAAPTLADVGSVAGPCWADVSTGGAGSAVDVVASTPTSLVSEGVAEVEVPTVEESVEVGPAGPDRPESASPDRPKAQNATATTITIITPAAQIVRVAWWLGAACFPWWGCERPDAESGT
jgi:hypothetical protein